MALRVRVPKHVVAFFVATALAGCATMRALDELDQRIADLLGGASDHVSADDLERYIERYFTPVGRLAKAAADSAPPVLPSVPLSPTGAKATVKGDPIVRLASGETFMYEGRVVFFVLHPKDAPELYFVDVRNDDPQYISSVWRRTGGFRWQHFSVPDDDRMLEVPLQNDPRFTDEIPPLTLLSSFSEAKVFLSFEGGVLPGPTWEEAEVIGGLPVELVDATALDDDVRANAATFRVALAHFRAEGFIPCDHLAPVARLLLRRFLEVSRAPG